MGRSRDEEMARDGRCDGFAGLVGAAEGRQDGAIYGRYYSWLKHARIIDYTHAHDQIRMRV